MYIHIYIDIYIYIYIHIYMRVVSACVALDFAQNDLNYVFALGEIL